MVSSGDRTNADDQATEDMVQREVRGDAPYDPDDDPNTKSIVERASDRLKDALPGGNHYPEQGET